jgi:hypothetical protein
MMAMTKEGAMAAMAEGEGDGGAPENFGSLTTY